METTVKYFLFSQLNYSALAREWGLCHLSYDERGLARVRKDSVIQPNVKLHLTCDCPHQKHDFKNESREVVESFGKFETFWLSCTYAAEYPDPSHLIQADW